MAALVFLVAIATQWTAFQLSLVADERFAGDADALTRFFGTFNFTLGAISFVLQLLVTGPALRRFGMAVTVLVLPLSLGFGTSLIWLLPGLWSVLITNAFDQGFRFSVDKASYELLYLPIPPAQRIPLKNTIDIIVNRVADGCGALLLGLATQGFTWIPGLGLGLRGTAAINMVVIAVWVGVAWRLRAEYVRTIHESIHRHRLDTERAASATIEKSAAEALRAKLADSDASEVRYALGLLEVQQTRSWQPALRTLLEHPEPDIRRRALSLLRAAGDREVGALAVAMLKDPDLGVRTESLLYLTREMRVDPLSQIQKLGDFEDFSIRAGMAAFLASPGPAQNLVAARALLEAMVRMSGADGARERAEAARLIALVPDAFLDLLATLIRDEDEQVARAAIRSATAIARDELIEPLIAALDRTELADEATGALARYGNHIIPEIERRLGEEATPQDIRRELPAVLVRIGTTEAEQALIGSLLQADVTLRHRVIASLNKLRVRCTPRSASIRRRSTSCSPPRLPGTIARTRCSGRSRIVSKTMIRCCRRCTTPWIRSSTASSGSWVCSCRTSGCTTPTSASARRTSSFARTRSSCSTMCSTRSCASCSFRCSTRRCRSTTASRSPTGSSVPHSTPPSRRSRRCSRARIRGCARARSTRSARCSCTRSKES